jgi:tight adherence protein B
MITVVAAACCVFAAVWIVSLPSPAALRLTAVFHGPKARPRGSPARPAGAALIWLRQKTGVLGRRRRQLNVRRAAVIEFCDAIAVELTAGRPAGTALTHAAEALPDLPGLRSVIDAARDGDDVVTALTRASTTEGCEALRLLAGCWRIGVDRGGTIASVIDGLAEALRDEQSHREDIALQLAGPRATARLLAGLPVLGLAMAAALGAHPLRFLFGTIPGALCLAVGTGLDALGLWWTARLATAAEQLQ